MPVLGLSKLDSVNRLLYAIGERPVASLATGGPAIESDAERFLDDANIRVQSYGWPENTFFFQELTADGSGQVVVPSSTLHIWPSGPDEHRQIALNGDNLLDLNNNSGNFGALGTVMVDRVSLRSYEDLSPRLKELITTTAMVDFQAKQRGKPLMDAMLQYDRALADMLADRLQSRLGRRPINLQPMAPMFMGGARQQERQ